MQVEDGLYRRYAPCACQERVRLREIRERRNVPDLFAEAALGDFQTAFYSKDGELVAAEALKATRRYLDRFQAVCQEIGGRGLYYVSRAKGSGKSMLAAIMVNELTKAGIRARFVGMAEMLSEIKAGFDPESKESSAEIIRMAMDMPVLVIDDIGAERMSDWVSETVYRIVDYRVTHKRPTIYTSNIPIDELKYDERIVDRIRRMAMVVRLPDESVRRKLAAVEDVRMKTVLGLT